MPDIIIENPVLNSPFDEPTRHFKFEEDGITDRVVEKRRSSSYFVPVPPAKKKGTQRVFEAEWTAERIEQNPHVNRMRERVDLWRRGRYAGVTPITRRLLEHWTDPNRENKLFFCQIEALETAIYIVEAAAKFGDGWIHNQLREANDKANRGLPRIAFKMATGSGKTVVMAMLIAWQALNKLANPQDPKYSDAFLIITPGITIRDRLRVLLPNDPDNYYRARDLLPVDLATQLNQAKILITNFHAFQLREKYKAPTLTKKFANPNDQAAFKETPNEMVRRVCKELGNKRNIVVINDEAHHCYKRKPDGEDIKLDADERQEATLREEEARIWINGIEAVKTKIGIKRIFDLSATPFFLRGSGYSEGTLFPWVVSDFSLIDAIESGIVKVPRVPVADDSMVGEMPAYRELWLRIKDELPKKGRKTEAVTGDPILPAELQGALHTLYSNYEKAYRRWEESDAKERSQTPPVFIVVCNNTNVSKIVFDYVAGYEKPMAHHTSVLVPGQLPIFSNVKDGRWLDRPNTILVDSKQLESGEAMSAEFKKMAAKEIEEFKSGYRTRFPGRDADKLTDEDILREVMNTVGKPGKLGEHVKCVVSVSMLTEGWDANTVTHILGVRAFGTQLLCEQVVGRGLRRTSYAPEVQRISYTAVGGETKTAEFVGYGPEYAEVYGVPFSFIPCSGSSTTPKPPKPVTRVRALPERERLEITFPRLLGYRFDVPTERLEAKFDDDSRLVLSTRDVPTKVENAPIIGKTVIHSLVDLRKRREQEVAYLLAKRTIERYFTEGEGCERIHLFPQVLRIARRWLKECVQVKDNAFKQLLLLHEPAEDAIGKVYRSIVASESGELALKPVLYPYDTIGSTKHVDFDTSKPTYRTRENKCHVSHVVGDTDSWEQKMAQALEEMDEVVCYVKNHNLGFVIPYTWQGEQRSYYPDFIARIDDGNEDLLNLVIEVTGEKKKDKEAKVSTAKNLWVPAVNNHGGLGRWAFVEIEDPWDALRAIRKAIGESEKAARGA
jgi:type III restriction enzyme